MMELNQITSDDAFIALMLGTKEWLPNGNLLSLGNR